MTVVTKRIELQTRGHNDTIDITSKVTQAIKASGLRDGIVTVFVSGSTGGVTTIEYESGVVQDLSEMLERAVPQEIDYRHNLKWGDGNGHSHVRASLIGPSLTVPFSDGELQLGTWQQIVFLDFDVRSRRRGIVFQLIGEGKAG